jgi:hypothetical protein
MTNAQGPMTNEIPMEGRCHMARLLLPISMGIAGLGEKDVTKCDFM